MITGRVDAEVEDTGAFLGQQRWADRGAADQDVIDAEVRPVGIFLEWVRGGQRDQRLGRPARLPRAAVADAGVVERTGPAFASAEPASHLGAPRVQRDDAHPPSSKH